jgi:hypothetical protein
VTVNSILGYWVRCRVTNATAITQIPTIDLIKLHTKSVTDTKSVELDND